jgi:hypothetical protein
VVKAAAIGAVMLLALAGGARSAHSPCLLSIAPRDGMSEATGQHTLVFALANRGSTACTLDGYPRVELRDAHGRLPFVIHRGGDQMLTARPPGPVRLAPGRQAYLALNKYRCDRGDKRRPTRIVLVPPGERSRLSAPVTGWFFGWCGRGDPGSTVSVTPIEPTFRALSRR